MKKFFAGIGIVLTALLLVWGVPLLVGATTSVEVNSGTLATGTSTATGAAINVSLGWTPREVVVTNTTGTNLVVVRWQTGMAAASCLKTAGTTTTVGASSNVMVMSMPTVSCISMYAGSTSAAKGFTIGADTNLNISGDTLRWRALR